MSALPPIADIESQSRNVRFVPKADIDTITETLASCLLFSLIDTPESQAADGHDAAGPLSCGCLRSRHLRMDSIFRKSPPGTWQPASLAPFCPPVKPCRALT